MEQVRNMHGVPDMDLRSFVVRPSSALSNASTMFRPASAVMSHASKLRDSHASRYTPTPLQRDYDERPPLGILRKQFAANSWFLANQRAPSQTRLGKPIHKEMTSSQSSSSHQQEGCCISHGQIVSRSMLSRSSIRPESAASHFSNASTASTRLRTTVNASRLTTRPVFGAIEEDHESLVRDLSTWAPSLHEAKPESLPSHYRTTTKHGSTAHTIWDFVWEKPVGRSQRIKDEIRLPEEWQM